MPKGKPQKKTGKNSGSKKFHEKISPLFHPRKKKTAPDRKAMAVLHGATLAPVTFSPQLKQIVSRLSSETVVASNPQTDTPPRGMPAQTWQTPGGTELELSATHCRYSINGSEVAFYSDKKKIDTADSIAKTAFSAPELDFEDDISPGSSYSEEQTPSSVATLLLHATGAFSPRKISQLKPIRSQVEITREDLSFNITYRPRDCAQKQNAVLGISANKVPKPDSISPENYNQPREILHIIGYSISPAWFMPQTIENFVIGSAAANTQMMISEGLIHNLLSDEGFKDQFKSVSYTVNINDYDTVTTKTSHGSREIVVAKNIISTIEIKDDRGQALYTYRQGIDVFGCDKPPETEVKYLYRATYLELRKKLAEKTADVATAISPTPARP